MTLLKWDESITIGVPLVDEDHRFLIHFINRLHDYDGLDVERDVFDSLLDSLFEFTEHHFRREERVMEACNYPDIKDHLDRHWKFERKLTAIQQDLLSSHSDRVGAETLSFIKDWLVDHILNVDRAMAPYTRNNPAAAAAAEEVDFSPRNDLYGFAPPDDLYGFAPPDEFIFKLKET